MSKNQEFDRMTRKELENELSKYRKLAFDIPVNMSIGEDKEYKRIPLVQAQFMAFMIIVEEKGIPFEICTIDGMDVCSSDGENIFGEEFDLYITSFIEGGTEMTDYLAKFK